MNSVRYFCLYILVAAFVSLPARAASNAADSVANIPPAEAGKTNEKRQSDQPELAPAHEQIIEAAEIGKALNPTGQSQTKIDLKQMEKEGLVNLPQALSAVPGLMMQQSSAAGGSPIMRGMVGNQVLILVDGQRLNNAIWRTGPVQYLNALNLRAFDRIIVQHGADSERYGGGALGGVIKLHSHQADYSDDGFALHGQSTARYSSAADAKAASASGDVSFQRLALHLGADIEDLLNLRGGRNTGLQADSAFQRGDISASARFIPIAGHELRVRYVSLHQYHVRRPDKCTRDSQGQIIDCRQRLEQFIDLASLRWTRKNSGFFDQLQASLDVQNFHELTERQRWDKGRLERKRDQDLVLASQFFASHLITQLPFALLRLNLGGELSYDQVGSQAWRQPLSRSQIPRPPQYLGEADPSLATLADGSTYLSAGAFVQQQYFFSDAFNVDLSLRYNVYQASAPVSDRLPRGLQRSFSAPSASLAMEYQLAPWLSLGGKLVHAYRAPNLYDLSGRDFFGGGYEFAMANELGPEHLSGIEGISRLELGALQVTMSAYANLLHDLIVRQAQDFAGSSQVDGEQSFARVNAGLAYLYGFEGAFRLDLGSYAELYANAAYTFGQDISHDEALSRIAPLMGQLGLRGRPIKKLSLGSELFWALAQERLSSRDIADSRILDGGTPGYMFVDLFANYQLLDAMQISARLHNLFDADYRIHGSALNGAGVEGRVAIRLMF